MATRKPARKNAKGPSVPRTGPARSVFDLARDHRLGPITASDEATGEGALVELAWDGHRVLACAMGRDVRLVSADLRDWLDCFPTIARALQALGRQDVVIEGFLCALGPEGVPSFELLRRHVETQAQRIVLACVDLPRVDDHDLRGLSLAERRERLRELVAGGEDLVFSDALVGPLAAVLDGVRKLGVRGVLVRGDRWLAVSATDEPVVIDRGPSAPPKPTNREKLMFPRDGLAKVDVIAYYKEIAPILLPYLNDRPLVGQRWPDGIDAFTWFQHRLPPRAPDYLRAVWIEGNRRIVAESVDALAWLANQAVLTFHGWASRCTTLAHPDWVIIDLDPGEGTTWPDVARVALTLRKLLELLDLPRPSRATSARCWSCRVRFGPPMARRSPRGPPRSRPRSRSSRVESGAVLASRRA